MMIRMNVDEYAVTCGNEIDIAIADYLFKYCDKIPQLYEAMMYSVTGGKRLRGISLLAAFQGWRQERVKAMDFAAAVEMIHAYSLVHDDLPCMDNDDLRRGKASCHKKYGEAVALLVGDALLTIAFEVMLSNRDLDPVFVRSACCEMAKAAGIQGMVGGQFMDLGLESREKDVCYISKMYYMKTASLFGAAASVGGILAGAPIGYVRALSGWGKHFGYAFQIIDDLQDLAQDGNDPDKTTLVKTISGEKARDEAKKALERSIEEIKMFEKNTLFFSGLSLKYGSALEESCLTLPVDHCKG